MTFPASLLETLSARPPTPPRDPSRDIAGALEFLSESIDTPQKPKLRSKAAQLDTPPEQSPSINDEHLLTSTNKSGKRVNFSPWTNYHKAPEFDPISSPNRTNLRPLPSKRSSKPLKSILKSQDQSSSQPQVELETDTLGNRKAHEYANFAEMLEVIVKQLASDAAVARRDAYVTLSGTLQAYEGEPDVNELKKKLPLLMQYIERDVVVMNPATNSLDMNLVAQSLKLALILMRLRGVSDAMTDEFKVFLVDRCITVLKDNDAPKTVVNNHLHFLSQQQVGKAVMTVPRVDRILDCLKDIEERIKGNSVIGYRLLIYQRLVKQSPITMITRISDWIEHLFHGMLSSIKDIRLRAIEICRTTGIDLGGQVQTSRAVLEILDRENDSGNTFADYIAARLVDMLQKKKDTEGVFAPQIWAAIVLLLRGRRHKLDGWKNLRAWLEIFQKMVNSSSPQIRNQANIAWTQFIFVVRPEKSTTLPLKKLLRSAIQPQLAQRKGQDKLAKQCRQYAFSSYYCLLYYALNPSAPAETLEMFWKEYIFQVWVSLVPGGQSEAYLACRLLSALFWSSSTHIWNEKRALEPNVFQPEDIPPLDPKWIRQKMPLILELVKLCLNGAQWNDEDKEECIVRKMWLSLMQAVAEAGSKEVTASMELKEAIASVMNMLQRVQASSPSSLSNSERNDDIWAERFAFLVETSMEKIGAMHFADRVLARNGQSGFEAAPTPTHRSRNNSTLQSPLLHLVDLISNLSSKQITNGSRLDLMKKVLIPCWDSRNTRKAKLELLKDCAQATLNQGEEKDAKSWIWQAFVDLAQKSLQGDNEPLHDANSRILNEEYRSVLRIINVGLHYSELESVEAGRGLLSALSNTIRKDCGETAITLTVTEPLSRMINDEYQILDHQVLMSYATALLENFNFPTNRRELERVRRTLLTNNFAGYKSSEGDALAEFYQMFYNLSTIAYETVDERNSATVANFLVSLNNAITSCPQSSREDFVRRLQGGICIWIQDENRIYDDHSDNFASLYQACLALWKSVVTVVRSSSSNDVSAPNKFESLINAGLLTSRKEIANTTIDLWNKILSQIDGVECPQSIVDSFARYRGIADVKLPSSVEFSQEEIPPVDLIDLPNDSSFHDPTPAKPSYPLSPLRRHGRSPQPNAAASIDRTPQGKHALQIQRTPRSKLRHEDSQIEFQAIESSPPNENDQESQALTERQREVRERQREEVSLFPDITSSPSLPVRSKESSTGASLTETDGKIENELQENLSTPMKGGTGHDSVDYYLGSSPTPGPNRKRIVKSNDKPEIFSRRREVAISSGPDDIDDIPSSPPNNHGKSTKQNLDQRDLEENVDLSSFEGSSMFNATTDYGSTDIASSFIDLQSTMQIANDIQAHEARRAADALGMDADSLQHFSASGKKNAMRTTLQSIQSDIFVDAVTDQLHSDGFGGDEFFVDASSFPQGLQLSGSPKRLGGFHSNDEAVRSSVPQFNRRCSELDLDSQEFNYDSGPSTNADSVENKPNDTRMRESSPSEAGNDRTTSGRLEQRQSQDEIGKENETPISSSTTSTPAKINKRKANTVMGSKPIKRSRNRNSVDRSRSPSPVAERQVIESADEDDNIFDCIVVKERVPINLKGRPKSTKSPDSEVQSPSEQDQSTSSMLQPKGSKRKRGRQPKRREDNDGVISTDKAVLVKDTPLPKKPRRRNSQSVHSESPEPSPELASTDAQVRRLSCVDVSKRDAETETRYPYGTRAAGKRKHSFHEDLEIVEDTFIDGELVSSTSAATSSRIKAENEDRLSEQVQLTPSDNSPSGRSILTPRSIINRLRKILADCQQLVLGSQEEREIDDVLFEVRREVHEAARRGAATGAD